MTSEVGKWLTKDEIRSVLARRDLIVAASDIRGPNLLFDLSAVK